MPALSAQRWQEVAPHLDRALDLSDSERAAWLTTMRVHDPGLAADLQSLLAEHHALAGSSLLAQSPAPVADQSARPIDPFGLVGQTLEGRFKVEQQVAEGGFGIVYRAHQLVLDRAVALKVLKTPGDLSAAGRATLHRTFEEEARTIARLKHPHIVDVYDFGVTEREPGGPLLWMAMEWLEGKTLEEELDGPRAGTLMTAAEALALLRPVLQTIGYAHRQQVVHRDLKPANIFLAEREGVVTVKVLDFGIAKIMAGADTEGVPDGGNTTKGFRAFSPDYAAPEQVAHARTDPGTDVHALGLILTRMLTGRAPYSYDPIDGDLFAAVMSDQRPSPAAAGHPVGAWESVLARAMARRPADRYQNADQLLAALEESLPAASGIPPISPPTPAPARPTPSRWRRPRLAAVAALAVIAVAGSGYLARRFRIRAASSLFASAPDRIVLAVLPFRNMTGDPKQEIVSDALTDGVIGQLGRLGPADLLVIARSSVIRYKGTGKGAGEIGQELGARYLLDSSVKRQGDELRVDAQLVRSSDQIAIWSDSYTGVMGDIQGLQNNLTRGVAGGIRLKLGANAERALMRKRPVKPEAYEAFLRAYFRCDTYLGPANDFLARIRSSLATYEEAVRIDPTFALAYARIAMTSIQLGFYAGEVEERRTRAKEAALRALALDPDLPQAHAALGAVLYQLYGDWVEGERHLRRALELDANQAEALETISQLWMTVGRFNEAIAARTRAVEIDPLSSFVSRNLSAAYFNARQYDAAIDVLKRIIAADPQFIVAQERLALCYVQKGLLAAAAAEEDQMSAHRGIDRDRNLTTNVAVRGYVYAKIGRVQEARRIADQLIEQARVRHLPAIDVARVHAGLGDREQTLSWLERAYAKREQNLDLIFLRVDPMWDLVRAEPRFSALIQGMGIPPLVVGG
jgi:serine/threonine protein kinase/TolB-like protein/Tfp pilus assembly protein PilF